MNLRRRIQASLAGMALSCGLSSAFGYEADVHFGLTYWLAIKAGYSSPQASAIAVGDDSVDGGQISAAEMVIEYACAQAFPEVARQVERDHYPSAGRVPSAPSERRVVPGSPSALSAFTSLLDSARSQPEIHLRRLGVALHGLQDSWAHQGEPAAPAAEGLACDPALAFAHPTARGGPDSHDADLTFLWPDDTVQMASATFDALSRYPDFGRHKRQAADWSTIRGAVEAFSKAKTKSGKIAWFSSEGIDDVSFLDGISLPDGARDRERSPREERAPRLDFDRSLQHAIDPSDRAFLDDFVRRWLSREPPDSMLRDMASPMRRRDLALKLRLWLVRDHGSAARFLHARWPLSSAAARDAGAIASPPHAAIRPTTPSDAVYPLQPAGPAPVALLPYIVIRHEQGDAASRLSVLLRFKHAPYDTVCLLFTRQAGRLTLQDVVSAVDY